MADDLFRFVITVDDKASEALEALTSEQWDRDQVERLLLSPRGQTISPEAAAELRRAFADG